MNQVTNLTTFFFFPVNRFEPGLSDSDQNLNNRIEFNQMFWFITMNIFRIWK